MSTPIGNRRAEMPAWCSILVLAIALAGFIARQRNWISAASGAVPTISGERSNDQLDELVRSRRSNEIVELSGVVVKVLPDDREGDRHPRFLVDVGQRTVLIAHN